ncbi:4010_t:CDS:2, partial [Scutellospora calospora]
IQTLEQNMASNSDRYAFIGLGAMGLPMAINLQKYLSSNSFAPLVVYNRTFSKTHAVKEIGAIAATSLKQVIEYANIIFTSLANDNAVNQTFNELLSESDLIDNNKKKIIFVETSTIEPTTVGTLREKVENTTNRILLYCPVLGPPEVAKNAMLSIIPSGNQDAINYMLPLLTTVLGKKVLPAGDDVKNAAKFKLIGNLFVFGAGELLSEGLTLAEKSGVDKEMLLNFISSPEFITNVYRRY